MQGSAQEKKKKVFQPEKRSRFQKNYRRRHPTPLRARTNITPQIYGTEEVLAGVVRGRASQECRERGTSYTAVVCSYHTVCCMRVYEVHIVVVKHVLGKSHKKVYLGALRHWWAPQAHRKGSLFLRGASKLEIVHRCSDYTRFSEYTRSTEYFSYSEY